MTPGAGMAPLVIARTRSVRSNLSFTTDKEIASPLRGSQ